MPVRAGVFDAHGEAVLIDQCPCARVRAGAARNAITNVVQEGVPEFDRR